MAKVKPSKGPTELAGEILLQLSKERVTPAEAACALSAAASMICIGSSVSKEDYLKTAGKTYDLCLEIAQRKGDMTCH